MIFYEDTWAVKSRIEKAIKKYGYAPEHNFWWYQAEIEKKSKNVFVEFKDGTGLLTIVEKEKKKSLYFFKSDSPSFAPNSYYY